MTHLARTSTATALAFLLLAGCTGSVTDNGNLTDTGSVMDFDDDVMTISDLAAYLQTEGHSVTIGDTLSQPFFAATATELIIGGIPVQVFEYATEDDAEAAIDTVSDDGTTIATQQVDWVNAPHFYQQGRMIVLYVGTDEMMLETLEDALGSQVAGGEADDADAMMDDTNDDLSPGTGGLMMDDTM